MAPSNLSPTEIQANFVLLQVLIIAISAWVAGNKLLQDNTDWGSENGFYSKQTVFEIVFLVGVFSFIWAFNDIAAYLGPSLDYLVWETVLLIRGVIVISGLAISHTIVKERWILKSFLAAMVIVIFLLQAYYGIWISG